MGWTGIPQYEGTRQDKIAEVTKGFTNTTVLKTVTRGNVFFSAMRNNETMETWCLVTLTAMEQGEFLYKQMDDTCGPYDLAPMSIINLLTPTTNKISNEWRDKCRAAAAVEKIKLTKGDVIEFDEPLTFESGFKANRFIFDRHYRFFVVTEEGTGLVRLPKSWRRDYSWKKVS